MAPGLQEVLSKVKQTRQVQVEQNAKVKGLQLITAAPQPQVS